MLLQFNTELLRSLIFNLKTFLCLLCILFYYIFLKIGFREGGKGETSLCYTNLLHSLVVSYMFFGQGSNPQQCFNQLS